MNGKSGGPAKKRDETVEEMPRVETPYGGFAAEGLAERRGKKDRRASDRRQGDRRSGVDRRAGEDRRRRETPT